MNNTKTKHTPGPWNVKFSGDKTISLLEWRGLDVCAADDSDYQQVQADARLIAAAPEMLEALQLVLNDNRLMNAMSREQARAILDSVAKATGGAE